MQHLHENLSKEDFLKLTHQNITDHESAALFGMSNRLTEFELWHEKNTSEAVDKMADSKKRWKQRLLSSIAYGFAEEFGLVVESFRHLLTHPSVDKMASTFDFKIVGLLDGAEENDFRRTFREHGTGILKVENVHLFNHKDNWKDDEAADSVEVQVQHQMEVASAVFPGQYQWAVIAPLIGGTELKPLLRFKDFEFCSNIVKAINRFWARTSEPAPDFQRDADFIIAMYKSAGGAEMDARGNAQISELAFKIYEAGNREKIAKDEKDSHKAQLLTLIGEAPKVNCDGFNIQASERKPTPPTIITAEMVGQSYGGTSGSRPIVVRKKST